ncbi:SRPBCC family protein [Jiangella mangrovi]|uniref:Carbon monoxide dehydrogenase subunit G n=1 Tax=Jiangella mangrovi TaxID=1524084 RepID=A0A7W9LMF6_9ACTN|nr:SRPBCC family protein [Jiangella mangrovi]MBB5789149.1 carbon monoxide dehydrogenase subunit G [Jiangella mangrovi]
MQIDNEFTVGVPVERAWEILTDLEGIAPCMPGAQLTGRDGDAYKGRVKIKVGPVVSEYAGTATFTEKDDAAHRAVISASGRDSRGAGNATAEIVAQLRPDGDSTVVTVNTDLRITGKIAQLGRGMIKEVSTKLLGQFVDCLEGKIGATPATPAAAAAAPSTPVEPVSEPVAVEPQREVPIEPQPAPSSPSAPAPEPEPLDIMGVAGGSIAKRIVPLILVLIVLAGLIAYLASR